MLCNILYLCDYNECGYPPKKALSAFLQFSFFAFKPFVNGRASYVECPSTYYVRLIPGLGIMFWT